jgi:hypothetical protein
MQFSFAYQSASAVREGPGRTGVAFQPDLRRPPTYFSGELADPVAFRECIGALHDVVISDLKFRPRDRDEFLRWKRELLAKQSREFWRARADWLAALYRTDRESWFLLDPVITVAPDEVFFEAFSKDESAYGRLSVSRDAFKSVGEYRCGTTNIDFSAALYGQFQRLRSRTPTWLEIDPAGFSVQRAGTEKHVEKKIDVPDSWVRGFLQVQSAMLLPAASFVLSPRHIYNLCHILRRNRERKGPRSLRWELRPDAPVEVIVEPWDARLTLEGSRYLGEAPGFGVGGPANVASQMGLPASEVRTDRLVIRTWGRRRLHLLERLLPMADRVAVHLLGRGMPSFFVAYLGRYTFTLGLSGWTANDWAGSASFDLMTARPDGGGADRQTADVVLAAVREKLFARVRDLARELSLEPGVVESALSRLCREGRVMYDFDRSGYRLRELTAEPLPPDHPALADERVAEAEGLLRRKAVRIAAWTDIPGRGRALSGEAAGENPAAVIDPDGRLSQAECSCWFFGQNRLRKGPCAHLLAVRMLAGV